MADITVQHRIALDTYTRSFFLDLVRPVIAGLAHLETRMTAVDDALAAIGSSVDELVKDVQRLIGLFTTAGELTPEQQAAVDSVQAKLGALDTSVEAVAPEA